MATDPSGSIEPPAPASCRITVMASGNGSNFQAILDGVASGAIPSSEVVRLFVNRKGAYAATRAESATPKKVPVTYFNLVSGGFIPRGDAGPQEVKAGRERYDAKLAELVLEDVPDLVVLAGWMHIFTAEFLKPLQAKGVPVINLHPALPGKYDGANAIERAFQDFQDGKLEDNRTGIMIHHVIEQVDRGQAIMKREIECRQGETLDELKQRIHSYEHELLVQATAKVVGELMGKRLGESR